MMTHTDSRPTFDCKFCHKKFISKRGLWDHETIHTGEKPYFCHLCPNKSFRTKQHLQIHTKVHTGERPFKCGICSKTFLQAGHLKTHMITHSEDEPFSCPNAPNCPKRFKHKQNSQLHFSVCRAEKPIRSRKGENEDESENESPPVRRYGGCPPSATRQKPVVPNFTKKESTIVKKSTSYIERAVRDGYSSFTYCRRMNWKKGAKWFITDLIGAGPGPKKKILTKLN